ncbi:MAG: hypothetical protein ACTSXP_08660 [Promethearchaeota archaeon]
MEQNIPVNPIPVVKKLLNKEDVVLYTIGLGEADDVLMEKLAEIGKGEFFRAESFQELWQFYDALAQRFSMVTKTKFTA